MIVCNPEAEALEQVVHLLDVAHRIAIRARLSVVDDIVKILDLCASEWGDALGRMERERQRDADERGRVIETEPAIVARMVLADEIVDRTR